VSRANLSLTVRDVISPVAATRARTSRSSWRPPSWLNCLRLKRTCHHECAWLCESVR
jgi:hypothetical protein